MKKSFVLYIDQYEPIKDLTLEQKGILLEYIFHYQSKIEYQIKDPVVEIVSGFFKQTFDRDFEAYKIKCEKNRQAAQTRWSKSDANACDRTQSNANGCVEMHGKAKHADSDTDTDIYPPKINDFVEEFQLYISQTHKNKAPEIKPSFLKKCKDTIDKLNRIDKFELDYIFEVINWSLKDDFWSKQIFSLAALRGKSPNGLTKFQNMTNAFDSEKKDEPKMERLYVL